MPQSRLHESSVELPEALELKNPEKHAGTRGSRISHRGILESLRSASVGGRGIVEIYRLQVLPSRTRTIHLLGHKCSARISNTLLGFEVQAEYKRIHCPDIVTARYLKIFLELGCKRIRLPYDPTATASIVSELEEALARLKNGVIQLFPGCYSLQLYVMRRICAHLRRQLASD